MVRRTIPGGPMSEIDVSLIGSGKRPHLWHAMVDSMKVQTVAFEWVISGPHPPVRDMPKNFTYIYSVLKPHQKHVITAKAARGRLLVYWNDDWMLHQGPIADQHHPATNRSALQTLVEAWDALKDDDGIVAP